MCQMPGKDLAKKTHRIHIQTYFLLCLEKRLNNFKKNIDVAPPSAWHPGQFLSLPVNKTGPCWWFIINEKIEESLCYKKVGAFQPTNIGTA